MINSFFGINGALGRAGNGGDDDVLVDSSTTGCEDRCEAWKVLAFQGMLGGGRTHMRVWLYMDEAELDSFEQAVMVHEESTIRCQAA